MSEPYRVAIVGCGVVSDMHFRGYRAHPDRIDVVAACDPLDERRRLAEESFGIADTFVDVDDLLAGSDFSVAVVCTPTHLRLATVSALAEAGKHIMVEKPMADTLDDAEEIVRICERAGVRLAVDQNFRDHYAFGLARDAIQRGAIGRVVGIDHRELMFREVQGWRAEAAHHALSVMGVHWFDGFRYLLADDADWLVARTYTSPAVVAAGETDAFVQVHFGDATVNYSQSFSSRFERVETIVFGEEGTLALDYETLQIATGDGPVETVSNPFAGAGKPESAFRSLDRLLSALDSGSEPSNSGTDNLKTLSLLAAAYQSAGSNEPVVLRNGLL